MFTVELMFCEYPNPVVSSEYGKIGFATNKTLSPKQISTYPVSAGFNALVVDPFTYASKWISKG